MSRTERLFDLLKLLRRHRRPVSGAALAQELGISLRTLYRDIASLQAQGAEIEGEAGVGYVLRDGFLLPPLMFTRDEIDALVLGVRRVASRDQGSIAMAARDALGRIAAVLPASLRGEIENAPLLAGPSCGNAALQCDLSAVHNALRTEHKLKIVYRDEAGLETRRIVWPVGIAFFDAVRIVVAWCELRRDFRHFRMDRMVSASRLEARIPQRRQTLLRQWKTREGVGDQPL